MNGRLVCGVEVHEFFKDTPISNLQAHPAESKAPISSMYISLTSFGSLFCFICQGVLD